MSTIVWEDPPADKRGTVVRPSKFKAIAAELRAHEGQWAKLYEHVWASNQSNAKRMLGDGFEVVARRQPHYAAHKFDVYARYVGSGNGATA